jgi:hypothetical protein
VKVSQGWLTWVRRLSFAGILLVAAVIPGTVVGWPSLTCQQLRCASAGRPGATPWNPRWPAGPGERSPQASGPSLLSRA